MAESTQTIIEKIALKIPVLRTASRSGLRSSRPLLGILAIALVVAIALPLINITIIFPAYTELLIATIETGAERLAAHTVPPSAKYEKLSHASLESPRMLADIFRLEKDFGLLKLNLYSPDGVTLYSSDPEELNTTNTETHFHREVATGNTFSELTTLTKPGPGGMTEVIDVVDTFIPIVRDDVFLGAFEFYFDVSPVKKHMDRFNTYATYGSIITSLCILIVVLSLLRKESSRIDAIRQADKLREDVDQITRHDLKSPLVGALNGINYLERYTEVDDDQKEMLGDMRVSVITGLDMINKSLDIYKMETGRYEYEPEPMDLMRTSRRVATDLSGLGTQFGVTVEIKRTDETDTPESLPIAAEETLLYSLIANLVKNGIEASSPDTTVTISIGVDSGVTLSVHNSGTVPESIRDSFFDKFTTSGKRGGTGLGTYSAQLMTRTMGGSISMNSSEEDGTTVTISLPVDIREGTEG